jgi:hypothetical protein
VDEITAAWIGVGGASAVGLVGWVLAGVANGRAKRANQIAEHANNLAADAVSEAREANQIAQNANDLSEKANTIAQTQALKQSDPSHVEWDAQWDREACVARITNRGRHIAVNATALVKRGKVEDLVRGPERIARGEEFEIPFPDVPEKRAKRNREIAATEQRAARNGIVIGFREYGESVEFDVRWESEVGNPGAQTIKLRLR